MTQDIIPLDQCLDRHVYRIRSRNLIVGVFTKDRDGFIGIREKFGRRYLDTEFHHEIGAPYGTAHPIREIEEATLNHNIRLWEKYPPICAWCGRPVIFTKKVAIEQGPTPSERRIVDPWVHVSTPPLDYGACVDVSPISQIYSPLFTFLLEVEEDIRAIEKGEK